MSDKDLISREDVEDARCEILRTLNYINSSGTLDYADYCELFNAIEREFDALKVAPHEMSAREFLNARNRMCKKYAYGNCHDCPAYIVCVTAATNDEWPTKSVAIVQEWAREHPETEDKDGDV